jgi:predicted AAA+ superfamily ATPase
MYFFDIGVANMLSGRKSMSPLSPEYGVCFEHLVFLELRSFLSYQRVETALTYWRTESKLEVDFVLGDSIAIEAKSGANIGPSDLKGLRALKEERRLKRAIVVSHEMNPRKTEDGIEILPIANFLDELWAGEILPE